MYTTMRWWRLAGCAPSYAWAGPTPHGRGATFATRGYSGGGSTGVRRPLRFLAWRLELDEEQLSEVAKILAELKTERAQNDVDRAKRVAAFADAVSAESFDAARAAEGAAMRVTSAERLRDASVNALQRLHAVLTPDQRRTLGYLIRTGSIAI